MNSLLVPLDMLASGEHAVIEDVQGEPHWVGRMAELGIRQGSRVQVLQPGRPCLLQIAGCRLCVRGDDSACILVRPD